MAQQKRRFRNLRKGYVTLITGGMFAGKSDELIRRLRRNDYARKKYLVFKPIIDIRTEDTIACRDGDELPAIKVRLSAEIVEHVIQNPDVEVIGIDEAQFFDMGLADVVRKLANEYHLTVLIAGLDMTFEGKPFGPIALLLVEADEVLKLHAICVVCGRRAQYSRRKKNAGKEEVKVGSDEYEAVCRRHRPRKLLPLYSPT